MSDEALDAHLQWLDDCARAQVMDYETWLEGRVAQLEAENAALKREAYYEDDMGRGVRYKDWCHQLQDEIATLKLALETTNSLMKDVY